MKLNKFVSHNENQLVHRVARYTRESLVAPAKLVTTRGEAGDTATFCSFQVKPDGGPPSWVVLTFFYKFPQSTSAQLMLSFNGDETLVMTNDEHDDVLKIGKLVGQSAFTKAARRLVDIRLIAKPLDYNLLTNKMFCRLTGVSHYTPRAPKGVLRFYVNTDVFETVVPFVTSRYTVVDESGQLPPEQVLAENWNCVLEQAVELGLDKPNNLSELADALQQFGAAIVYADADYVHCEFTCEYFLYVQTSWGIVLLPREPSKLTKDYRNFIFRHYDELRKREVTVDMLKN